MSVNQLANADNRNLTNLASLDFADGAIQPSAARREAEQWRDVNKPRAEILHERDVAREEVKALKSRLAEEVYTSNKAVALWGAIAAAEFFGLVWLSAMVAWRLL